MLNAECAEPCGLFYGFSSVRGMHTSPMGHAYASSTGTALLVLSTAITESSVGYLYDM